MACRVSAASTPARRSARQVILSVDFAPSIFAVLYEFPALVKVHSIRIALIAPHTRYEATSYRQHPQCFGIEVSEPPVNEAGVLF